MITKDNKMWKKSDDDLFNVLLLGAELCDRIGLYALNKLKPYNPLFKY